MLDGSVRRQCLTSRSSVGALESLVRRRGEEREQL